ncbi:MAG: trypsin-like peptidase domain-containing protein, partial [Lachnospiraceae bacterium]|nr:trypsin-like peptidase domain-containing protein [Lachnospiraceae bacterium]
MSSENKKPNKFLSFLWIVFLGIVFGVCAGVAYTGIALVSNKLVIPAVVGELPAQTTNFTPGPSDPIKPNDKESDFHAQIEEKKEEVIEEVEDIVMANGEYTVAEVAENCMPAIVSINVVGDYDYNGYKYEGESAGSGIIVGQSDNELLIATNYHVVENNKTISINFCDGNDAPATVKGKKVSMDLAVVAVDLSELSDSTLSSIKIAIIGNSDETKVGEG